MHTERTFALIKPDAIDAKHVGDIISAIEKNGFTIRALQMRQLSEPEVKEFYAIHNQRPFFQEMVSFIVSAPVILMVLERENAIKAWRDLMGATNPAQAAPGTIRQQFGTDIGTNCVHGSDAPETARVELKQFFPEYL